MLSGISLMGVYGDYIDSRNQGMRHHLKPRDAESPWDELRTLAKLPILPPQHQIALLQHIRRRVVIADERENVSIQPVLTFGQRLDEVLGWILRWHVVIIYQETEKGYKNLNQIPIMPLAPNG